MSNFKVLKEASVDVRYHTVKEDDIRLMLIFDNKSPYIFEKNAKENNLISETDLKTIKEYFNKGTYIFVGDTLVDYRSSMYTGYVRDQNEINLLSDVIGTKTISSNERGVRGLFNNFRKNQNPINKELFLGGDGHTFNLSIDGLGEGGEFKNKLVHQWSPFSDKIVISLETERLICENGMVGMSSFVTKQVPIVNRHLEHLELINVQLAPEINSLLKERFSSMSNTNASLSSMMKAHGILKERNKNKSPENITNLSTLKNLVDVEANLAHIYEPLTFKNKEKCKTLKGNITQFDLFNILTEASTHSNGDDKNTMRLQKEINCLVFDELEDQKNVQGTAPTLSSDSDHKRAFFGK